MKCNALDASNEVLCAMYFNFAAQVHAISGDLAHEAKKDLNDFVKRMGRACNPGLHGF